MKIGRGFIKLVQLKGRQKPLRWLSHLTWELPQTLLGWGAVLGSLAIFRLEEVQSFEAGICLRFKGDKGAVAYTLGNVILIRGETEIGLGSLLCQHEYGHCLQSRSWGPLYLLVCALPSMLSFWLRGPNHKRSRVEIGANRRAMRYFREKPDAKAWNPRRFPIH